eukprot:SAG31_NODE_2867_length_4979_cov_2.330123_4_plen_77_part_00
MAPRRRGRAAELPTLSLLALLALLATPLPAHSLTVTDISKYLKISQNISEYLRTSRNISGSVAGEAAGPAVCGAAR